MPIPFLSVFESRSLNRSTLPVSGQTRKVLAYLAGDHRWARSFSPRVLAFLDTDGARVFNETISQLCVEESLRGYYLSLCHADNLFRKTDNGESLRQLSLLHRWKPMWF